MLSGSRGGPRFKSQRSRNLEIGNFEALEVTAMYFTFLVTSNLFLFGQVAFWIQLMKSGNYVQTNNYFSSFYIFTALHGLHLLGGLLFWGKVASRVLKTKSEKILDEEKNISALSMYWTFLLVVWLAFFLMIYVFNDAFIEWCKTLVA